MKINTNFNKIALSIALLAACSNLAFADGNAFTPLNFDDASYSAPKAAPAAAKPSSNPISNALSKVMPSKSAPAANAAPGEVPIGNDNIQNAILELDNAQVGIRNDLLNYKAKYADVDAQYKLIKNERTMLNRQVNSIERRIKNIDRAKEKIRRNML
ncbi:MAG: hypothetical protein WCY19_06120 [Candidatus Gastranaerophilaceae bacterium]